MALFDDYENQLSGGGGWLSGLLGGGGGGSTLDLYGDLFTDAQKKALQQREMTQGLFRMAEKLGALAQPSRAPPGLGGTLGALGAGLGAFGGGTGEETALKGMQTAEAVRASQEKRKAQARTRTIIEQALAATGIDPNSPQGQQAVQQALAEPPAASAIPAPTVPPPPSVGALPDVGAAGEYGVGQGPPAPLPIPPAPPGGRITPADYGAPGGAPVQNTGLLGAPDQVVGPDGQPLPQGVLPNMLASFTGGMPGGRPPFRLAAASSQIPGAAGDILDSVVAPLESGNRNIHQQVVSPKVSTAQGYYQITNSTWKDTAPKAGVDLGKYPNAMSAPREVQKQVAQKLYEDRGLQPWADFNPRVAAATGYRRGGRFAGAGPDAGRIPAGGGDQMQAISALLRLTGGGGDSDSEDDPLAALLANTTGGGAPDTVVRPDGGSTLPIQQATAALAPYATGNARLGQPSSVAGVGADMSGKIERMVQAMPPGVRERFLIISGYRDAEQQHRVNPGVTNSRHMHGAAVDLTKDPVVLNWINQHPEYGLGFPLASDPKETNHLEMIDPATGGRLPIMRAQYSPGGTTAPAAAPAAPAGGSVIPGLNLTAQQLGLLGALSEASGLDDPFKSLLNTYYKSPGYLAEKARTETRAQKEVAREMDPLIAAGVETAKAKVDFEWKPKIEEAVQKLQSPILKERLEAKADIDRYSEELKQDKQASLTPVDVNLADQNGQPVAQKILASEFAAKQKDRAQRIARGDMTVRPGDIIGTPVLTPEETAKQTAAGQAPYKTEEMTLTWPDGETRKVKVTGQQGKDVLEGKPVPAIGWPGTGAAAGATTTDSGARLGEVVYPQGYAEATTVLLKERRPKAEAAIQSLNFNETASRLLDAGIISGYGAGLRLDVAKAKALLGWDDQRIANTEAFLATQTRQVASALASGAFGSGSSITEEDRRQAANMVGQNANLDEKSLRSLVRLNDTAANWEIDRYNNDVQRHDPKGRLPILRVDRPPKAEAQPSANQPKPIGTAKIGDKPYVKWSDGQWRPEGELPGQEKR